MQLLSGNYLSGKCPDFLQSAESASLVPRHAIVMVTFVGTASRIVKVLFHGQVLQSVILPLDRVSQLSPTYSLALYPSLYLSADLSTCLSLSKYTQHAHMYISSRFLHIILLFVFPILKAQNLLSISLRKCITKKVLQSLMKIIEMREFS